MSALVIDEKMMEYAVFGGAVLGGGGGGWIDEGLQIGRLALEFGQPELRTIDEFADQDTFVTVSLVGAPGAKDKFVKPIHYAKSLDILAKQLSKPISAIHTNENGAGTTVNGWLQSVVTGIPLVDFACNGRAHPTGTMGSMNLTEIEGYVSHQTAVGGKGNDYIEMSISGTLDKAASMIRRASVDAGGLVAVARNPVTASYAKANGAAGAISMAINVGEALLGSKGEAAVDAVVKLLGGIVITSGEVTDFQMETTGGFDVGTIWMNGSYEMTFWNEYMTIEKDGQRMATFPDLIMTFDAETARPVVTAAVKKGQHLIVISVPKENLLLSSTMQNQKLMLLVESIINKSVLKYL